MDCRRIKAAKASIDHRNAERPFGINRLLLKIEDTLRRSMP